MKNILTQKILMVLIAPFAILFLLLFALLNWPLFKLLPDKKQEQNKLES